GAEHQKRQCQHGRQADSCGNTIQAFNPPSHEIAPPRIESRSIRREMGGCSLQARPLAAASRFKPPGGRRDSRWARVFVVPYGDSQLAALVFLSSNEPADNATIRFIFYRGLRHEPRQGSA